MEQKNKQRARFKTAVIWVLAINFCLLVPGLLIQGCKDKDSADNQSTNVATNDLAMQAMQPDTNTVAQPPVLSNTAPVVAIAPTNPPTSITQPVPTATGSATTYKIQAKDSFYTIAKQFHVTVKAIQEANPGLDPKKLKVGKDINIPAPTATQTAVNSDPTAPKATATADSADMYTVKPRENLTVIAKAHGTTPKAIIALNSLKSDRIKAGDKLKMPAAKTATSTTPPAADATPIPSATPTTPTTAGVTTSSGSSAPATIR
jgi:LysM repeat protein